MLATSPYETPAARDISRSGSIGNFSNITYDLQKRTDASTYLELTRLKTLRVLSLAAALYGVHLLQKLRQDKHDC